MLNKKTRILYLTTTSQLSGAEKMLCELAIRLDKKKYEVMVCALMDDLEDQLLDKLRKENIKTDCLNLDKKWKLWKTFKLFKIIKDFNPDILQSFLFFDNILARVVGKLSKVSIIISGQRNVETHRSNLRNFFDKITLFLADYIVSNSKAGKEILIKREKVPGKKIRVIYNGIEMSESPMSGVLSPKALSSELRISDDVAKIGFVGSLTKQKGVEYLLEAIEILRLIRRRSPQVAQNDKEDIQNYRKIKLIIIGDGEEREKLEKRARSLGIENSVCFWGREENAWEFMKEFTIFVLPSLWEGMPNVVLEAMSQGVPVVATKVGGVPEILRSAQNDKVGFLVEPKNPKALAEKIEYVLSLSEEERKRIGENARRVVKEGFSVGKMVGEYERLYKDVVSVEGWGEERTMDGQGPKSEVRR
jgi:L-malate glycosyltransferase